MNIFSHAFLSDVRVRESSGEPAAMDPISAMLGELLSIQQDMKTYQQDRKQLW